MKLMELTQAQGRHVLVNPMQVRLVSEGQAGTRIEMADASYFEVKEDVATVAARFQQATQ
jgi:hypothetical protein